MNFVPLLPPIGAVAAEPIGGNLGQELSSATTFATALTPNACRYLCVT